MKLVSYIVVFLCVVHVAVAQRVSDTITPSINQQIIDTVTVYGPTISPTYKKAVCTELLIKIIEKFHPLTKQDKSGIRIITNDDVYTLLAQNSPVPKGVYNALIKKR